MKYRVYADGNVLEEEYFEEFDNTMPYSDDYQEIDIPEELYDYLQECFFMEHQVFRLKELGQALDEARRVWDKGVELLITGESNDSEIQN